MPVSSVTEHWIKPDAVTINLNHFGDPDYLQVSVLAGAVVMAFKQDVIAYNAAHNYRTWPLQAANTYLETTSAYNVYARLTRSEVNASALIIYDSVLRDIEGRAITYAENGSEILGNADTNYFYVFLGQISGSIDNNGEKIERNWEVSFRFGNLDTSQYRNEEAGGEWMKMFRLNKVTDMIEVLKIFSSAVFKKLFIGDKEVGNIHRSIDNLEIKDDVIPTTKYTEESYLSKKKDDHTPHSLSVGKNLSVGKKITTHDGLSTDDFLEGASGASVYQNKDGQWCIETDNVKARRKFSANDVDIQSTDHIGGQVILTAARMRIDYVLDESEYYRCYFRKADGEGNVIRNEWKPSDLAYCNTFNLERQSDGSIGNHYYWREVVAVSSETNQDVESERTFGDETIRTADYHFVDLSKLEYAEGSNAPKSGDKVVQLGYSKDDDSGRQSAIVIAGAGTGSPYIQIFEGIHDFSLPSNPDQLKPGDNRLSGRLTIKEGSTGWENLEGLKGVINKQSSDLESFANSVTKEFENIRNEMDGAIDTWFGEEVPTLNNYPAVDWITEADMDSHLGDLYYSSNRKAYRFQYTESDGYHWDVIEDSEVVKALELAQKALDTADGKRRVFIEQPIPPYDLGDLWAGGDNAPLMRCVVARESGSFYEDDWDLADNSQKYADAIKTKLEQDLNSAKADIDQAIVNATNASKGYTDEAKAAIQASINSLEQNKADLSAVYEKAIVDGMVNDAEAEAIRQANEVAQAQRVALEARVNAYADGQISEAEQRAIDKADRLVEEAKKEFHASITAAKNTIDQTISDVQGAMTSYTDEAKQALQASITQLEQAKANVDDVYSKTLIDGKVTALEEFATNEATEYAKAAREAAETNVKAWADGVIDEAEQNAINEAQKKVDAAKEDLEAAMDALEGDLTTLINNTKNNLDDAIAKAKSEAESNANSYTDEGKAALQASINELNSAKANVDAVYTKAQADGVIKESETRAILKAQEVATAAQELAEANVKAWADGEIDAAEARAIADAEAKLASAKAELEEAIRAATPEGYYEFVASVTQNFENLQEQIDGALDSYFDSYEPTLQNAPASEWTTDTEKEAHLNDTFTNLVDGRSWRWTYNNGYQWTEILDTATTKALALAGQAQQTADKKRRVFVATPNPPYDKGDLWTGGKDTYLMVCVNPKIEGQAYAASDWDYADNTKKTKEELEALVASTKSNIDNAISQAKNEAENNAKSYTDEGKAVLQASINALNETKANISNVYLKASEDDTISDVEARALAAAQEYAKAAIGLTDITVKAYADGIVSAEEQARITEAQNNLAEAKRYAEEKADEAFNDAEDLVDNLEGGKENLLRNTGFFGDYVSASLLGEVVLSETSEMYSPSLQHWTSSLATAVEMSESESGKGVRIENGGFIQQSMFHPVNDGEKYVFSFRGKGGSIKMSVGQYSKTFTLSSSFGLYFEKFVANGSTRIIKIEATGACDLCELQLERGTIRSAWGMSPLDNQSAQAQYESMTYLKQAIEDGSSEFVGGLALANLLFAKDMSGNVKAGMSGIYNDDHSVAFFGGGNYEQAIATALKYADNPSYQASESEIQNMAKFVVTHGGRAILNDVVLRGYIYALGGKFKGEIEATSGVFKNVASPNNYFNIDENGNADFRGGKIGNFEVSGGWLGIKASQTEQIGTNSLMALMNNGIVFNSATRRALLGVISSSGSEYLGKFEDKTQHIASNRGLWFDVQNSSTANLAFFGNGAGVLNGMMCGYGVQIIKPTDNSIYSIENLTDGNVIIVDSIITSYIAFPTIKEVRNAIELGSGNFAVKLTVIKKGRNSVHIYGRGSLGDNTNYPNVYSMEVGANEAASFILYYDGSDYNVVRL